MKTAILFGASGLVGSHLLTELLNNPEYTRVTVVVRKPLPMEHAKLQQLVGDYHALPSLKKEIQADEIFIALGTTRKNTPDQTEYYRVDHDYPVLAASLAKENGAQSVLLVSAVGANPKSNLFYVRTKGKVEEDIIGLGFEHTYIFQPSMLMGNRLEHRPMEQFLIGAFRVLNPLLVGGWKKYRGIWVADLAKAMIAAANDTRVKVKRYCWEDISKK